MTRVLSFPTEKGGTVLVEVEDTDDGPKPAGRGDRVPQQSQKTFEAICARIKPVAEGVLTQLKDLASRPDQVEVRFSVRLSSKADVVLASTSVGGQIDVVLTWNAAERHGRHSH